MKKFLVSGLGFFLMSSFFVAVGGTLSRASILQTDIVPYLLSQDEGEQINNAKALINDPAIPQASEIDFALASMFGSEATTIDSLATDSLVDRIESGLLPYLQASLEKLGDNKQVKTKVLERSSVLQTDVAPYILSQDKGKQIDDALDLINDQAIPDASDIDATVSSMFGYTATTIDSLETDPLVPRIENGLLPYLQAALENLGDYNKIVKIAAGGVIESYNGGHLLVLTSAGRVYATGYNDFGQLGLGDFKNRYVLTPSIGDASDGVTDIFVGPCNSYLLKGDKAYAVGWNKFGQLGIGTREPDDYRTTFTLMGTEGASGVKALAGGYEHTILLKNNGSVYGAGFCSSGQLGIGVVGGSDYRATLTLMLGAGESNVDAIAANEYHTILLKNGAVYSCGQGGFGQLGIGTNPNIAYLLTPMIEAGSSDVAAISTGYDFTVILKNDGSVWGTGSNAYGQLGIGDDYNGTDTLVRMLDEGASGVDAIACGYEGIIVLKGDKAYACGANYLGELGIGTSASTGDDYRSTLTLMAGEGMAGVIAVAAGPDCTYILKNDNRVYAAGWNEHGEIGLGEALTSTDRLTIVPPKYLPLT